MFVCHCLWSKLYWQNSSAGTSWVRRESFLLSFAFSLWTKMSATREGTQSESFEGWKKSCDKDFLDTCPQPEEGLHMSLWRMNTIIKSTKTKYRFSLYRGGTPSESSKQLQMPKHLKTDQLLISPPISWSGWGWG